MEIADMMERNIPHEYLLRYDVRDVDPAWLHRVEWFHASPVCKEFSTAKTGGEESDQDRETAAAVARYIAHHHPTFVTIENVWQYRKSASWQIIYRALRERYGVRIMHVNMADYGVPQTRKRMIVIAHLDAPAPPKMRPTHMENPPEAASLFDVALPKWRGWYEAIEDLIPSLPDSEFAPWQLKRLPDELKETLQISTNTATAGSKSPPKTRIATAPSDVITVQQGGRMRAFVVDGKLSKSGDERKLQTHPDEEPYGTVVGSHSAQRDARAFIVSNAKTEWGDGIHNGRDPALTVSPQHKGRLRAMLVSAQSIDGGKPSQRTGEAPSQSVGTNANRVRAMIDYGNTSRKATVLDGERPSMTVSAWHGRRPSQMPHAFGGRVVQMTPRALARFQTLPDWYDLSGDDRVDVTAIGNGVPSLFGQRLGKYLEGLM
jgi:site-specific DNA-cytosine methylase